MESKAQSRKRRILAVLAHPDDETFGMGGTLALYASQGVEVFLVCATRGEVGEVDASFKEKFQSAACLRTQELKCAAEILGIREVIYLNYRDSGMPGSPENQHPNALAAQPVRAVAEKIAHIIRNIKPDVILTFDPIGGYRHPDHIAVHQATVLAFELAAQPGSFEDPGSLPSFKAERLYFHVINRTFLKASILTLRLLGQDPRQFGKNKDIDLLSIAEQDFPTHVCVNYTPVADLQAQAAACHASQGGGKMNKGLRGLINALFVRKADQFMQAYPAVEEKSACKRDLFAGLSF